MAQNGSMLRKVAKRTKAMAQDGPIATGLVDDKMRATTGKPRRRGLDPLRSSANVSDVASEMMAGDNVMMRRAKTEGRQFANRRGLLNSTMAAEASMGAVVDRLSPLIEQESRQRFTAQQSKRDFQEERARSGQDFREQRNLNRQTGDQAKDLSEQEFGQSTSLTNLEYDRRGDLQESDQGFQAEQAELARRNELRQQGRDLAQRERESFRADSTRVALAEFDRGTQERLSQMDIDARRRIAEMEVSDNNRRGAEDMITSIQTRYQEQLRTIMGNTELGADERARMIDAAQETHTLQLKLTEDLFKIDIAWPEGGPRRSASGSTGGSTGGSGSGSNSGSGSGPSGGDDREDLPPPIDRRVRRPGGYVG